MKHIALALLSSLLLLTTPALAQSDSGFRSQDQPGGYQVTFDDDPLGAGGIDPNGATIQVRKGAIRQTLIRPRTTFVSEMLKSVENL